MADPGDSESRGADPAAVAGFGFADIRAIADAIPMMIAYCDTELRYRFVNRALAEWFEQPRKAILGQTMAQVLGPQAYPLREPMLKAALAGERQWFAADFVHPTRGPLAVQTEYIPQRRRWQF